LKTAERLQKRQEGGGMTLNGIFNQQELLGSALQASMVRNNVIVNNIANADTPGYKKRSVTFEQFFQQAVSDYRQTRVVNLQGVEPMVIFDDSRFKYRIDENNVDIEMEMVSLYENSVKYDVVAGGLMNNYRRFNSVLTGIR
jgi:flagellar basal-body rod protein FlgB